MGVCVCQSPFIDAGGRGVLRRCSCKCRDQVKAGAGDHGACRCGDQLEEAGRVVCRCGDQVEGGLVVCRCGDQVGGGGCVGVGTR